MRKVSFLHRAVGLICALVLTTSVQVWAKPVLPIWSWNFDWDDNVAFMPSKIYVYHKKNGEEKVLSSAEFSDFEHEIGKSGQWIDYEFNLNQKSSQFSFREVRDLPGHNLFLDQIELLLKLPAEKWQGPSWNAFVKALSHEESAKWTTIITARRHSRKKIYEGLKRLKKAGYIKYLPKLSNIFAVNSPEFQKKFGNKNTATVKLAVIKKQLDLLQKQALDPHSEKVTSEDGTTTRPMHHWGFSDNDSKNYFEALRGLSEEVQKNRWPDIKISLFYTGPPNSQIPNRALVLYDGVHESARPFLPGEIGQLVDSKEDATEIFGESISPSEDYLAEGTKPSSRIRALEAPIVVRSDFKSASDILNRMYVSHSYPSSVLHDRRIVSGVELTQIETDAILKYIQDPSVPNRDKRIILTRYEIANAAVVDALILANKNGIPVSVITDLNASLSYSFSEDQKWTVDFLDGTFKDTQTARATQRLLESGYKINDKSWGIFSQPLYPTRTIAPIMHEKNLLLWEGDKSIKYWFGTSNMTDNPRYNRLFEVNDYQSAQFAWDHAQELIRVFSEGGRIQDVKVDSPHRIIFPDESFVEYAYTDGKFNPNQRIVDLLAKAASPTTDHVIKEIIFSEFVLSNKNIIDAIIDAMKVQEGFRVYGVLDQKFIDLFGYGLGSVLGGYDSYRPMGSPIRGLSRKYVKRMRLFAYQRGVPDVIETSLEGPPIARHLWHDKTFMIRVIENGKDWTYIFTGSLNRSSPVKSAEFQAMFKVPTKSWFVDEVKRSIITVVNAEKTYALPLEKAQIRLALAQLIGHRELEVSIETVDRVLSELRIGNFDGIAKELRQLAVQPTTLMQSIDVPLANARIQKFNQFMNWFKTHPSYKWKGPAQSDFLRVLALIARPELPGPERAFALNGIFWSPGLEDAQLDRSIQDAAKVLEITDPLPSVRPRPVPKSSTECRGIAQSLRDHLD